MVLQWIWTALYWVWIATELYVAVVTRTRRGGGKIDDRGSMLLLWVVIFSSIFIASWLKATTSVGAMPHANQVQAVAVVIFATGLMVRLSAIYTLGRAFSANVAIRSTQSLNRSGLFRYVRHPSYTGLVVLFFALGLHMHNWYCLLLVTLPPLAALLYRIHVEEDALVNAFGEEYREYQQTTNRLIPGVY